MRAIPIVLWLLLAVSAGAMDRVVVIGDSNTADTTFRDPGHLWHVQVARSLNWVTSVLARGCQTAGPSLNACFGWHPGGAAVTYYGALQDLGATKIVIFLGVNDCSLATPLDDFRAAYRSLLEAWPWEQKVCIIPTPAYDEENSPNQLGLYLADYRQAIRDVCWDGVVVETEEAMPWGTKYYRDGVHLTAAGHRKLRSLVLQALQ